MERKLLQKKPLMDDYGEYQRKADKQHTEKTYNHRDKRGQIIRHLLKDVKKKTILQSFPFVL